MKLTLPFITALFVIFTHSNSKAQGFVFNSGPIPMCDTSYFTANVVGIGSLVAPGGMAWGNFINNLEINITSNHPHTLKILLTSPAGTILELSSFNGGGGNDYIDCNFLYAWAPNITTGTAPFSGSWMAEGGSFSIFDGEFGSGTWTVTVIDTACSGNPGPGPIIWTDGWFDGNGSGGIAIGFGTNSPPPLCMDFLPTGFSLVCPGTPVDILSFYTSYNGSYQYTIYDGWGVVTNPTYVITPGIYSIEGYDPFDGCLYYTTYEISNYPVLDLGPDLTIDTCTAGSIDLTSLFNTGSAVVSWSMNGSPITQAQASVATQSGVYEAIVQNTPCPDDAATITLNIQPGVTLGPDQNFNGCATAPFNLAAVFNTTGLTTSWTLNGNPVANPSAVVVNGTYTLAASNGTCTDTALVTIFYAPAPNLGPDQASSLCQGGSFNLTSVFSTGANTTAWYFNGNPVSNPSSVSNAGAYMLIASNAAGCSDTAMVTLSIVPGPSLGANQSHSICVNESIDLTGLYNTTGYTVSWSLNGAPVANPSNISVTGIYTLTASQGGCTDSATVTISQLATPVLGTNQFATMCPGGSFNLTSLYITTGLSTSWSVAGVPYANPSSATLTGTYTLIATNPSGCSDTALATLAFMAAPSLGANQSAGVCAGASYNLSSAFNTSGSTPVWYFNNVQVASPGSVTIPGVYTLIATSGNGCADTALLTLSNVTSPQLGSDQSMGNCFNTTVDLTAQYNTAGYTTAWTINGNAVPNPTSVSTPGTYQLIASAGAGCADTALVTITLLPATILGNNQATSFCPGTSVDLSQLYLTTGATATWSLGGSAVSNPYGITLPGSYQLVVVNSLSGCSDTAQVLVSAAIAPAIGPDQSVSGCSNEGVNLSSLYSTGNNSIVWTFAGNPLSQTIVNTPGNYNLVVTNAAGCSDSAVVTVSINASPGALANQTATICDGSAADLSSMVSSNGNTLSWTLNGVPVADPSQVTAAGNYQLVATAVNGCTDTSLINIILISNPNIGPDQTFELCPSITINLETIFPLSGLSTVYYYNGQPTTLFSAVHDPGTYLIEVTDVNGCTDQATALVSEMECICTADMKFDVECLQESAFFSIEADSAIVNAHWNFGNSGLPSMESLSPEVNFVRPGNFLVTLEVELGCGNVVVEKEIIVQDCAEACSYYIPSAFSPNNDGRNDLFTGYGDCLPEEFTMSVYNRYGQRIFETDNPLMAWDGSYDEVRLPAGIYIYSVSYKLPYQKKHSAKGTVAVIR